MLLNIENAMRLNTIYLDNESDLCIVGDVPNIFESDESNHDGPYDGVEMGC